MMVLAAPLPPRARGKQVGRRVRGGRLASTPACAGQTRTVQVVDQDLSLYPRLRGANWRRVVTRRPLRPLPPPARGKHLLAAGLGLLGPSTPACAGQTRSGRESCGPSCLYPRLRGANEDDEVPVLLEAPLPPPARGKRAQPALALGLGPSTPACAGQTIIDHYFYNEIALYPRLRGANCGALGAAYAPRPLPPPARGKRGADPVLSP